MKQKQTRLVLRARPSAAGGAELGPPCRWLGTDKTKQHIHPLHIGTRWKTYAPHPLTDSHPMALGEGGGLTRRAPGRRSISTIKEEMAIPCLLGVPSFGSIPARLRPRDPRCNALDLTARSSRRVAALPCLQRPGVRIALWPTNIALWPTNATGPRPGVALRALNTRRANAWARLTYLRQPGHVDPCAYGPKCPHGD